MGDQRRRSRFGYITGYWSPLGVDKSEDASPIDRPLGYEQSQGRLSCLTCPHPCRSRRSDSPGACEPVSPVVGGTEVPGVSLPPPLPIRSLTLPVCAGPGRYPRKGPAGAAVALWRQFLEAAVRPCGGRVGQNMALAGQLHALCPRPHGQLLFKSLRRLGRRIHRPTVTGISFSVAIRGVRSHELSSDTYSGDQLLARTPRCYGSLSRCQYESSRDGPAIGRSCLLPFDGTLAISFSAR